MLLEPFLFVVASFVLALFCIVFLLFSRLLFVSFLLLKSLCCSYFSLLPFFLFADLHLSSFLALEFELKKIKNSQLPSSSIYMRTGSRIVVLVSFNRLWKKNRLVLL